MGGGILRRLAGTLSSNRLHRCMRVEETILLGMCRMQAGQKEIGSNQAHGAVKSTGLGVLGKQHVQRDPPKAVQAGARAVLPTCTRGLK